MVGITLLLMSTIALVAAEYSPLIDDVGWAAAGLALLVTLAGCLTLPFVPHHARALRPPMPWRVVLIVLAVPSVLAGLVFSVYLIGLPFLFAGIVAISIGLGFSPRTPLLACAAIVCIVASAFYWLGAFQDHSATFYWIAGPTLSAAGLGATLMLWRGRSNDEQGR